MTPEALASIHARCFDATPRPWSAEEFAALLALETTMLVARVEGFALGRVAGPEAELMTLAVLPEARRRGLARALLADFEARARARGAAESFLEVAETNAAAQALYGGAGYVSAGYRRDYYSARATVRVGALVLRKVLAQRG
jgi:[ribosomal protein S18]-alanine N-acetyltransferase